MTTPSYALIMLAAGIGIPILAALNASLGRQIGAPAAASVVLFAVAFATAFAVVLFTGPQAITKVASAPKHLLLAGVLIAFYVLSITYIAPHFGVGNAVFFVLLGQLISAALIDHFALFGATQSPLTLTRAAGIAVMAAGVFLTQITGRA
ncbi:transporter family-2 protein [Litoreibacter ponti]|uniref:Transporter family-2 protein n=1 Tax=Litoreibacter ponti TaxID=1510457 RepID=A0A2T6BH65_9RHOB|nr:DMT family transporter [Litoreibacter ponti]PTX55400.1 transporter family-2 protein [Litoreibacter ponti]